MSVMLIKDNIILVDHQHYLNHLYKNVSDTCVVGGESCSSMVEFKILQNIFSILFDKSKHKMSLKRTHDYNEAYCEVCGG